jgi:hypothetical protein
MVRLNVNGQERVLEDVDASTPLLWVLRDLFGLVGTKFGCGGGYCGACTVHLDGKPIRSCSTPFRALMGSPSQLSRAWPRPTEHSTRCRRPGSRTMSRSVAIVRQASL